MFIENIFFSVDKKFMYIFMYKTRSFIYYYNFTLKSASNGGIVREVTSFFFFFTKIIGVMK